MKMSFFAKSYFFLLSVKHELLVSDFNSSIFVLSVIISNKSQLPFFRLEKFLRDVLRSFFKHLLFFARNSDYSLHIYMASDACQKFSKY